MKKKRAIKKLTFRNWVKCLLIVLMATLSIGMCFMRTHIRVVAADQWSSPRKICNGYYPSLAELDGTIWLAYTTTNQDPDTANEVQIRYSSDGGNTWSNHEVIFEAKTEGVAWCAHHTTFLSSTGQLLLVWNSNRNPGGETTPAIWFTKSTDHGETWATPQQIGEGNVPQLVEMQNKIWLFFDYVQSVRYITTSNQGNSWSEPVEVTPYLSKKGFPSADYAFGEVWLVYANYDTNAELDLVKSADGITWTSPQKICNLAQESLSFIKYYNGETFVFFPDIVDQQVNIYYTTSSDGALWSDPLRMVDDIPYYGGFGDAAITGDNLWLLYTDSSGEIRYTTFDAPIPAPDVIWQQWWFWTIAGLCTTNVVSAYFAIKYYRRMKPLAETIHAKAKSIKAADKTCQNCGAQLPAGSEFCGKCGAKLE